MNTDVRKCSLPRLLVLGLLLLALRNAPARGQAGAFTKLETHFEVPGVLGNPFDYTRNDVRVTFTGPDGKAVEVPAFFDGGATWRVRHTPTRPGRYVVTKITRNGARVEPRSPGPRSFSVDRRPVPGFVRRDPKNVARFRFDNGDPYYPLGHNVAWKSGDTPDVDAIFAKMGPIGENWSRVWMNHWDNKNLDWVMGEKIEPGRLSLDVARRWDAIVEAAEKNGVYFQMVLQHHGQYTTRNDSNWNDNPWNKKNGGFLETTSDFFTDPRARALTKSKYRYIVARWGYSPAILAWELFNEVQWTNAVQDKRYDIVAAWHREMAAFLREQDPNRHLVTTSSDERGEITGLYDAMDYLQPHAYPPDAVSTVTSIKVGDRPVFLGEIGPGGNLTADDGSFLHTALWGSLMSEAGGAAQYWTWDHIDRRNLYGHFASAAAFMKASGLAAWTGLRSVPLDVQTKDLGSVSFGPGGGWGQAKQTEFTVPPSGAIEGIGEMPPYLQGQANRALFPKAVFHVDFPRDGTCTVNVGQISRAGGHLVVRVDGNVVAERDFPAPETGARIYLTADVKVPAGKHTIELENTGADWVLIRRITFSPYGPTLRALGRVGADRAALWLYPSTNGPSDAASPGTVAVPGLAAGQYRVTWWDTRAGRESKTETVMAARGKPLILALPAVQSDIAAFLRRSR